MVIIGRDLILNLTLCRPRSRRILVLDRPQVQLLQGIPFAAYECECWTLCTGKMKGVLI